MPIRINPIEQFMVESIIRLQFTHDFQVGIQFDIISTWIYDVITMLIAIE